ncbi:hypothetical protein [Pseudomonas sp. EpS/L25]|uniref:hypothetical protein n=1 Tax=Pseudomonas sp. EpS/L25 TaxID=1749078 RepID=UPI000AC4D54C|nr:hypothetical protein [Pseudomonas sp. EpS/L25]
MTLTDELRVALAAAALWTPSSQLNRSAFVRQTLRSASRWTRKGCPLDTLPILRRLADRA